jgi:hypothetical protein
MVIIALLVTAYEAGVFLSYLTLGEVTYLSKIKPPNQIQPDAVNHKAFCFSNLEPQTFLKLIHVINGSPKINSFAFLFSCPNHYKLLNIKKSEVCESNSRFL